MTRCSMSVLKCNRQLSYLTCPLSSLLETQVLPPQTPLACSSFWPSVHWSFGMPTSLPSNSFASMRKTCGAAFPFILYFASSAQTILPSKHSNTSPRCAVFIMRFQCCEPVTTVIGSFQVSWYVCGCLVEELQLATFYPACHRCFVAWGNQKGWEEHLGRRKGGVLLAWSPEKQRWGLHAWGIDVGFGGMRMHPWAHPKKELRISEENCEKWY